MRKRTFTRGISRAAPGPSVRHHRPSTPHMAADSEADHRWPRLTVFLEQPITLAITLIGIRSDWLLFWPSGTDNGWHDHGESAGTFQVVSARLSAASVGHPRPLAALRRPVGTLRPRAGWRSGYAAWRGCQPASAIPASD